MTTDRKEEKLRLERSLLFPNGDLSFMGELIHDAQSQRSVQSSFWPIKRQVRDETPAQYWISTFFTTVLLDKVRRRS
jgi:hypothetical protein